MVPFRKGLSFFEVQEAAPKDSLALLKKKITEPCSMIFFIALFQLKYRLVTA